MALFGTRSATGDTDDGAARPSIGSLLTSLPDLIRRLIRGEVELAKAELIAKLKAAGLGIGLLVGAAVFGFLLLEVLIAAAVLGVATALPAWLAALLVGAALLVITAAFAFVGIRSLKRGVPPVPSETVKNVKNDVHALKGERNAPAEERA